MIPSEIGFVLRIGCGILTSVGFVVMVLNTATFFRMVRDIKNESYVTADVTSTLPSRLSRFFMVIFLIGYIVGTMDLFFREVEPMYMFVALIFFLASVYLSFLLKAQGDMLKSLREKNKELMTSYVNSIEMKDAYTKGHSRHVHNLVELFWEYLPSEYTAGLNQPKLLDAALLHDIGKMSVDDRILKKTGPLTPEEWSVIKTHTANGRKMLEGTCFEEIGDWVLYHHERIDGHGYHGLTGDHIPLASRIISIADTYSALATDRAYRSKKSHDQIVFIMRAAAGTQLDVQLTEIFTSIPQWEVESAAEPRDFPDFEIPPDGLYLAIDDVGSGLPAPGLELGEHLGPVGHGRVGDGRL